MRYASSTIYPPARQRWPFRSLGLLALTAGSVLIGVACGDEVVRVADVAAVVVEPAEAEVGVGDAVQLSARGLDEGDRPLSGFPVTWHTSDSAIATVNDAGVVTGKARGEVEITAGIGDRVGNAVVEVLLPPSVELEQAQVEFSADADDVGLVQAEVAIANSGELPLTGLTADIDYGDGPGGWLAADLESTDAPTLLIIAADLADLAPGTYTADVVVAAASAPESVRISVSLEVRPRAPSVPAAPSGLVAMATEDVAEIGLAWTDNSGGAAGYRIERRAPGAGQFAELAAVGSTVVQYTDTSVDPDGTYVYRVAACADGVCSPFSGEASATTHPLGPTGLTADATSSSRIDLSWTDNAATETGFRIERRRGSGGYSQVATAGIDQTFYSDGGLDPETTYTYRVRACNDGGCSGFSDAATATTQATAVTAPAVPAGFDATATGTTIALTWSDIDAAATGLELARQVGGSGGFAPIATLDTDATAYEDTGLAPGTRYDYRLRACNAAGCSNWATAGATTAGATTPDESVPDPPSDVSVVYEVGAGVRVSWSPVPGADGGYRIERRAGAGGFEVLGTVDHDPAGYLDTGVGLEAEYTYRIRACSDAGCSEPSNGAAIVTPPVAPSNLRIIYAMANRVQMNWRDNSDTATFFRLERSREGGDFNVLVEVDQTSHQDRTVDPATTYTYRVRACNANGCSPPSNVVTATTSGE